MAGAVIELTNLVYLSYASNVCYTTVTDIKPDDIIVNIIDGTWYYNPLKRDDYNNLKRKIGKQTRHCNWGSHYGVIGVYDRTNIEHLNSMVRDAKTATEDPHRHLDD